MSSPYYACSAPYIWCAKHTVWEDLEYCDLSILNNAFSILSDVGLCGVLYTPLYIQCIL